MYGLWEENGGRKMLRRLQILGGFAGMVVGMALVMGTAILLRLPLTLGF